MHNNIAIKVTHLTKKLNKQNIVNNLNFKIEKGSVVGFLGPNGSGKTTTLRLMTRLLKPDEGKIEILGNDIKKSPKILEKIGAIIEKPEFYLSLTGYENLFNLGLLSTLNDSDIPKRISEVIDVVGLSGSEHKKVKSYSLGMKQRLGIAQALLANPEILILDEPTNGIDPIGLKDLRNIIVHFSKNHGKTFLISSHMLHELEDVFSHLIVIDKGELLWQGKKDLALEIDSNIEKFFLKVLEHDI